MMAIPRLGSSVRTVAPVVLSVGLLAGCGASGAKEPNADQIGHTLLNQVYKLLEVTAATDIKITDALFDKYVQCANDKVKLTYGVSGKPISYAATSYISRIQTKTTATPKQIVDDLVQYLPQLGSFTVAERAADGGTVKVVGAATRTRLTLHSPAKDQLRISGETDCLRAGNLNRWPTATPKQR
jgi:hypothetical protein